MHVGFTGTQHGMTDDQKLDLDFQLFMLSEEYGQLVFHHGDCIGADAEAHMIACQNDCFVEIHPPKDPKKRAWCEGANVIHPEYGYKVRNKHIVNASDILFVAPRTPVEEVKSGTWMTWRYARSIEKPLHLLVDSSWPLTDIMKVTDQEVGLWQPLATQLQLGP